MKKLFSILVLLMIFLVACSGEEPETPVEIEEIQEAEEVHIEEVLPEEKEGVATEEDKIEEKEEADEEQVEESEPSEEETVDPDTPKDLVYPGGQWEKLAPLPLSRSEHANIIVGNKAYMIGGLTKNRKALNQIDAYDFASDTWKHAGSMIMPLHHLGVAEDNGFVYTFGGINEQKKVTATVQRFDPITNKWTVLSDLPTRRGAGAAIQYKGNAYYIGGADESGPKNANEVYNFKDETWKVLAPMPTAREHLAVGLIGDKIYVVGGRKRGLNTNLGTLEAYNIQNDTWETLPPMPTPRSGIAAVVKNGRLHVFGGESSSQTFRKHEAYDPQTNKWYELKAMPSARHGVTAVNYQGKMYVFGGGLRPGFSFSDKNEVFVSS